VLIETVFAWPGIGRLAYEAVVGRDYTVLMGVFIVTSIMVVGFNILTDIVYTLIDPRIGQTA
jgi:peptide/nickel transport system permease protein